MGFKEFRKSSHKRDELYLGQHRFEHWFVDNQVYFITARVRGKCPAFRSKEVKEVFWDRFEHYVRRSSFTPWVTSLLDNHYHTLGYLRVGTDLPVLMKGLHGSVAKLVNDLLDDRIANFWSDGGHQTYFDGCIRDELQARRAYRYTLRQGVRHGIVRDWRDYPHTRKAIDIDRAVRRSHELEAFPYKRYEKHLARGRRSRWDE